jgi:hypothetical protein
VRARRAPRAGAFAISFAAALALASCSDEREDCACTELFAFVTITVVDGGGTPVEGATVVVTREQTGDVLPFGEESGGAPGVYVVYDDSRKDSTRPGETILISGSKDTLFFEGAVQVTVDLPCRCHVSKQAGPDTLVATQI